MPDVCQLGNTWIPEFAALDALEPLDTLAASSKIVDRADYFAGIWDTNVVDGGLYGVPWYVDTRLLFYRSDLLAQAGFDAPPRSWAGVDANARRASRQRSGPDRYAILLPLNEFEPLLALASAAGRAAAARRRPLRQLLEAPASAARCDFYVDIFRRGCAPPTHRTPTISNVWNEFGRGYLRVLHHGPVEHRRVQAPPAAGTAGDWMTAPLPGPDGPGASIAGGSSLVDVPRVAHARQAAWQLIEYLSEPDVQVRFHDADRRPAAAAHRVARRGSLPMTSTRRRFAISSSA